MGSLGDSGVAGVSRGGGRAKFVGGRNAAHRAAVGDRVCVARAADVEIFSARAGFALSLSLRVWPNVVELNQILAATMFGDLEQVQNAEESRLAREFLGNVGADAKEKQIPHSADCVRNDKGRVSELVTSQASMGKGTTSA